MAPSSIRDRFPQLYEWENGENDYRTRTRTVPMKVLALGLPRTGTLSLQAALKQLGYIDTHHMTSVVFKTPEDGVRWGQVADLKSRGESQRLDRAVWDQLLGHCQAACDLPSVAFAEELIAAYPDAKVILQTREIESWYKSCVGSIFMVTESPILYLLSWTDREVMGKVHPMIRKVMFLFFGRDLRGNARQVFVDHHALVRRLVPAERLLDFRVTDGWAPLCAFLDNCPVPETPFPHVNDQEVFGKQIEAVIQLGLWRSAKRLLVGGVGVAVVGVVLYQMMAQ